jgi:hypothetical protein
MLSIFEAVLFLSLSILFFFLSFFILIFNTLPVFLSYLDVSESGLEYRYWFFYHIRCTWDDIENISIKRGIVSADVIFLNQATEIGSQRTMKLRKMLGLDLQHYIPLNVMDGWPNGKLNELLRFYASRLFNDIKNH